MNRRSFVRRIAYGIGAAALGTAVAIAQDSSEKAIEQTFRFNYHKARRLMRAGDYTNAISHLVTCDNIRAQSKSDKYHEKTNGVVTNQFPRRELGICHYYTGDYRAAMVHLNRSASETLTHRATSYIDKTHNELEKQKSESGIEIIINSRKEGSIPESELLDGHDFNTWGTRYNVHFSRIRSHDYGKANRFTVVKGSLYGVGTIFLKINECSAHIKSQGEEIPFEVPIRVHPKTNQITITLTDSSGETKEIKYNLSVEK